MDPEKRKRKYNEWLAPSPEKDSASKIPRTTNWRLISGVNERQEEQVDPELDNDQNARLVESVSELENSDHEMLQAELSDPGGSNSNQEEPPALDIVHQDRELSPPVSNDSFEPPAGGDKMSEDELSNAAESNSDEQHVVDLNLYHDQVPCAGGNGMSQDGSSDNADSTSSESSRSDSSSEESSRSNSSSAESSRSDSSDVDSQQAEDLSDSLSSGDESSGNSDLEHDSEDTDTLESYCGDSLIDSDNDADDEEEFPAPPDNDAHDLEEYPAPVDNEREPNELQNNQQDQHQHNEQEELEQEPYYSDAFQKLKEKLLGPLGAIMPTQPRISIAEFLLNALTLVTHFKMNFAEFEGVMKLTNTIFRERILPDTRYLLDKLFMAISGIHYHFVCSFCKHYLGEYDFTLVCQVNCENCKRNILINNLNNCIFFVMFDLASQIEVLLSSDIIFEALKDPFDLFNNQEPTLQDVYNGSVYQNFLRNLVLREPKVRHVTTVFGVDGSSPYSSSNCQFWPIFCNILELPPKFRAHNLLLAGLWFGKGHPVMDVFLIPFAQNCKKMSQVGFQIIRKGEKMTIKCHCIGCCADAPARAALQCIHQYGGGFSCHWCLHPSEHRRYTILDYEPQRRTQAEIIDDATMVLAIDDANPSVNGVTGLSPLITTPSFNIIDGMLLEYFHACCHGVAKTILGAWLGEDGCDDNSFYIGTPENLVKLNKFMKNVSLPIEARRSVRDFDDWAKWKGREFENFILYHCVPMLEKILPRQYLNNWIMFVQAMHFLLQEKVTESNVTQAHRLLTFFGKGVSELYPERHMTYNMHIVSNHLAEHCRRWGPLWSVNGYSYEDGNRILKNKIHANKGISSQVCRALSHTKCLEILRAHVSNAFTDKFQSDIEKKTASSCIYVESDKYLGTQKKVNVTPQEEFLLNQKGIQWNNFVSVPRVIHNDCLFSISKKSSVTDNSIALLKNGNVVFIHKIIVCDELNEGYLLGRNMVTTPHFVATGITRHESFLKLVTSVHLESIIISPSELDSVCARITLPHGDYIVKVPNIFNTT